MSEVADVPPGVVTVTSTVPAAWAGEVTVICVLETKVTPVPGVPPKLTVAALVNPVPVIVTRVPPANGPDVGEMPVTVGGSAVMYAVLISSSEPNIFVAVRLISYVPFANVHEGFCVVANCVQPTVAFLYAHFHDVGAPPVDASVKVTVKGAYPDKGGVALNPAMGADKSMVLVTEAVFPEASFTVSVTVLMPAVV